MKKNTFLLSFFAVLFLYLIISDISRSVFLQGKNKINILFYNESTRLFSIDKTNVDYIISFANNANVLVPGGYGYYRVGGLNKLIQLIAKPDLFQKTISSSVSALVDLYYYPSNSTIYYKDSQESYFLPSIKEIFFDKSNATITDRIFTFFYLTGKNQNLFKIIKESDSFEKNTFNDNYQGTFYDKIYRDIGDNVQILYKKDYVTATLISQIIDGEGIRVVDLSQLDETVGHCEVTVNQSKAKSEIAADLGKFFGCPVKIGETPVSDIILKLGNLESDWAVK